MVTNLESGGAQDKYYVIDELKEQQSVKELCSYLGVSRSGYYAYVKRRTTDPDGELKLKILAIYEQRKKILGYRRIQDELYRQHNLIVNHKKVLRLMQELGIKSIIRRKYKYQTSHEAAISDGRVAENLLKRNFHADGPNQKWVTDVTQYRVFDDRVYLSAIKDLWNGEIVAYHISNRNDNPLVLDTFRKAFKAHKDVSGLIVHSDQGSQYTSHAYHDMLPKVGARISMSRRGNCYDNASMESFFSHLKVEALYPYDIRSIEEVQRRIEEFIRFYNEERAQKKLNKLTPVEYRRQLVA
ncbi:IS3 family transposase [Paenibacillus hexagrammi]|uniref:IS3 family transposase n=1 Tax=Paenibacillus hexagrammi TaxID=2908839 RepID=A0ABY3SHM8_9BACL|nr:IS3 family transposase [Paenibacillus sp. YPD9-1]UJF32721.1 IS3 family transposase [Paenibacillus sp. YPD9-1]UJF33667.1 IS3 family transposase [Paenibacillus sp. YPD9-1]UJF33682.1 IS3 family transposase [Paenibacillus sp. YPD9-1]UJF35247.1 IS3 family transposase [Paenibacillus sp. YPD9-1]